MSFYGKIYQAGNSVTINSNNIEGDDWIDIVQNAETQKWHLKHTTSQNSNRQIKMVAGDGKVYMITLDQAGHITDITETVQQNFYVDDGEGNIQIFNSLGGATQ